MNLGCLCRTEDQELDNYIFQMFDLCETKRIMLNEIRMMLINFPDMGFSNSHNINIPDKFYLDIKESVIRSVQRNTNKKQNLL